MALRTLTNAKKQIRAGTISEALFDAALVTKISKIAVNEQNIADINAARGAANGIATLGADGKLLSNQIPAIAVSDHLGDVSSEAAMLALTGQRGDWATRTDESQSYMLIGDDASVLANWKPITTPNDGVTDLRNASGTITGKNGSVTLADIAFSGSANDVSFSHAKFSSANVSTALVELKDQVDDLDGAYKAADVLLQEDINNVSTQVATKVAIENFRTGVLLEGTIDRANRVFTLPAGEDFEPGTLVVTYNGTQVVEGGARDYTISGTTITFAESPDYEDERPFVNYIKKAA